jgi:hypothetical protein
VSSGTGRISSPAWTLRQYCELGSAVKFALASCGTRGNVELCALVGLELLRREREVRTTGVGV